MSDSKQKRMSVLDNLAVAGTPSPTSMMASSRPLRAARDAVDGHKIWALDPADIVDNRVADRLAHDDIIDLRDSIETTGQTVPILVRRHPSKDGKYLLVYGRRRLEAIRSSNKVNTVRALIAALDDDTAVQAQISENMARRDLTYIEKALFAHELIESGFGSQTRVAEVLTVGKSAISMGLSIVEAIGVDLVRAIGPAQGVGRPKWDAMAKALETTLIEPDNLVDLAHQTRDMLAVTTYDANSTDEIVDSSVAAFDAVLAKVTPRKSAKPEQQKPKPTSIFIDKGISGNVSRTSQGLRMELGQGGFTDWFEEQAQDLMKELHDRWQQHEKK